MGTRGRQSGAALAVTAAPIDSVQRPDAPYELTDEETTEWWAVVNSLPADWFPRETHAMLAQYCRHVVNARRVAQLIDRAVKSPELDVAEYGQLLKMQDRESRVITSLATKMRLSQQATVRAEQARKPKMVKRPWENA